MSAAPADKQNWVKQNYDKLLLVALLIALLASALYLLWRIRGERNEIEQGSWQNPSRPVPAELMDLSPYVSSNAPLTDPFMGAEITTNLLMASEIRVSCVNLECARPIPYSTAMCPFCQTGQPDPDDKIDRDGDNVDDRVEIEIGMDPSNPNDGMADFDGDGFTNVEEVMAETDINDETSTPPPAAKLRLWKAVATPFEVVFAGALGRGESQKFQLNASDNTRTYFALLNEDVVGWKVIEYRPETDDSDETLVLQQGDKVVELSVTDLDRARTGRPPSYRYWTANASAMSGWNPSLKSRTIPTLSLTFSYIRL